MHTLWIGAVLGVRRCSVIAVDADGRSLRRLNTRSGTRRSWRRERSTACGWAPTSRRVRTSWRQRTECSSQGGYCATPQETDGAGRPSTTYVGVLKSLLQDEVVPSRTLYVLNCVMESVPCHHQTHYRQHRRKPGCCQCSSARPTSERSADRQDVEDAET